MADLESIHNRPYYRNGTVSIADLKIAGTGISGGYDGNSFAIMVLIILFSALSMYNALELVVLIFSTFRKYNSGYFWSLLVASIGVIPYSLGFLFKFGNITVGNSKWLAVTFITIGWYTMVTGQSCVLWSRLHLILEGEKGQKTLHWTRWMIIINVFLLHLPTTVLTYGSNGHLDREKFVIAYNIMEKVQMSGFFLQEVILSSIYIKETLRILRTSISIREHTKRFMWQLMSINIVIIIMDLCLLGLEAASLYLLETLVKSFIYSVKLKLEFAILGQFVQFVGRPGNSVANEERVRKASTACFGESDEQSSRDTVHLSEQGGVGPGFASNSSDLSRLQSHNTYDSGMPKNSAVVTESAFINRRRTRVDSSRLPPGMTLDDVDVAMFQHTEDTSLPSLEPATDTVDSQAAFPQSYVEGSRGGDDAV